MSKAKATFRSIFWNHAGKILEYVLMYATSILIARGLGAAENGKFAGLLSLSQLLLVFCSFGLETSLNKFIPQLAEERQNEKVTFILRKALLVRLAAFFTVALLFYVVIVLFTLPIVQQTRQVLIYVLVFTGMRSVYPIFAMVLTARLRTALTARINIVIRALELLGVIVIARFGLTVENIVLLFLSTSLLHTAAYATFSGLNLFAEEERVSMNPIIRFGSIYWINIFVDFVLGRQGDVIFLTNLLPDPSQGGLYDVAYSVAQFATMAMTVGLGGVMFATFAQLAVTDQEAMDRFYGFSIRLISLLTIPLYAFILFNAGGVLNVLYTSQYSGAVSLVQGIIVFRMASRLFGGGENAEYLLSHGKVGAVVGVGIVAALVNFSLNLILIPKLGAAGSVIASGSANLLVNLLGCIVVLQVSVNTIQVAFWLRLVVICILTSALCWFIVPGTNAVSLLLAGVLYVLLLGLSFIFMKPITALDYTWLSQIDGRFAKLLRVFSRVELESA